MPRKPLKWYQEISLPMANIRERNGQMIIPIPKRTVKKYKLKGGMNVHPIIFVRTDSRHMGEMKSDEVNPIIKKKDYVKFKKWKEQEDNKIRVILKSLDNPQELTDEELELIRDSLNPETYKQLREALKSQSQSEDEDENEDEEQQQEKDYYQEYVDTS